MNKSLVGLAVILSVSLITIVSCSDKNSTEACLHEASMNLDSGNYDAVLASTCAAPWIRCGVLRKGRLQRHVGRQQFRRCRRHRLRFDPERPQYLYDRSGEIGIRRKPGQSRQGQGRLRNCRFGNGQL